MDIVYFIHYFYITRYAKLKQLEAQLKAERNAKKQEKQQTANSILTKLTVPKIVAIKPITYTSITYGQCGLSDMDWNWHMNNGRYLRHFDFARLKLLLY